jgi:opacity protein-like surface antigen
MSGRKAVLAALTMVVSLLASSIATAQEQKNELNGMIGRVIVSDQGITGPNAPTINPFVRSGKGLSFEANYSRFLLFTPVVAVSGEVVAVFNPQEKLGSGGPVVPTDYRQIFITPAARINLFPATAVSPWVSVGGGFAHFSESSQLIYNAGPNPGKSTTSGTLEGGVGLDVRVWNQFSIRGEVRDFWSGEPDFPLADTGKTRQHNFFVGGGVVWHF